MSVVLTIDFATLFRIAGPVIQEGKPILIRGKHGVGKSEVVYAVAKKLAYDEKTNKVKFCADADCKGMKVVERRASQMTEGDLVGLPSVNGNRTAFNPPDWFKEACESPVVLFLDEVDRATIEVRQGIFELTDSRKLNGHNLHPGTRIFAAVNGGKYAQQYQVGEMDPAELDRWTVFDVEPTVEDWMTWANAKNDGIPNVHSAVVDFLNHNRNHLEHLSEYEPNKKYPSRRSWKRASDVLNASGMLEEYSPDIVALSAAFVGMEAGVAFGDFLKNHKKLLTPNDIIKKGKWKETEKFSLNEHCALIQKMEAEESFKATLTEKQTENLANYFEILPSEAAALLFSVVGKSSNQDNIVNVYTAKTTSGETISDLMVKVLTLQEEKKEEEKKAK